MRIFLARSTIALLLAQQLLSPAFVFCQDVRQRRARTPDQKVEPQTPTPQKSVDQWKTDDSLTVIDQAGPQPSFKQEPTIRVALATDVRSATISTAGHLMNASAEGSTLVAMDVARVRLEPRLLSPLPATDNPDSYKIQIAGLAARVDADLKSKEVREAIGEDSQAVYDTETKTWGLLIGARRPLIEAEELRARLEERRAGRYGHTRRRHIYRKQFLQANSRRRLSPNQTTVAKSQSVKVGFCGCDSERAIGGAFQFAFAGSGCVCGGCGSTL